MRLTAQIRLFVQGEDVFRKPSFWDNVKGMFGSDVDLRTGESKIAQNALGLTETIQQALKIAGITNAVTLVVDDAVIYQDIEDRPDDADLLVQAMRLHSDRFQNFNVLRAVFEFEGQGLHSLIEVNVRAKAQRNEPHAIVAIGSRIEELRPKDGEDLEVAKDRIGKSLGNAQLVPMYRNVLNALAGKLHSGLQRVFPTARIESDPADVQVVRPSGGDVRDMGQSGDDRDAHLRSQPSYGRYGSGSGWSYGAYYDPWNTYYRDPMDTFVSLMVIDALISPRHSWGYSPGYLGSSWSSYGSPVTVVNYNGAPIGNADNVSSFSNQLSGVSQVMDQDFSTQSWDDHAMAGYDQQGSSWEQYGGSSGDTGNSWDCDGGSASSSGDSGGSGGGGGWDCAGGDSASSGSSWDCAASDCASSDCSSDCSWDCS